MKRIKRKELNFLIQNKRNLRDYDLNGADFSRLDLSEADLSSLDLSKAKFKKCLLKKANFSQSILKESCFFKADLEGAEFHGALCEATDFTKANLSGVVFTQTSLLDIIVYKAKMKRLFLQDVQIKGGDFSHVNFSEIKAERVNLKGINLSQACLTKARFEETNFEQAVLSGVEARGTIFFKCLLPKVKTEGSLLEGARFLQSDLTQANLKYSSLKETEFQETILEGADLRFSRGLSEEKKHLLHSQGAIVSFISAKIKKIIRFVFSTAWACTLFLAFLSALGVGAYFYFTNLNHLSIFSLEKKLTLAKQRRQFEKALQIDLILVKKYKKRNQDSDIFNNSLDAAQMYKILGKTENALEILKSLLNDYGQDAKRAARVKLELALVYKERGDLSLAMELLNEIEISDIEDSFSSAMKLAQAFWHLNEYSRAADVYLRIIKKFQDDPDRLARSRRRLSELSKEMEERKKLDEKSRKK